MNSCILVPAMKISDNDRESYLYDFGSKMGLCMEKFAHVCVSCVCEGFSCVCKMNYLSVFLDAVYRFKKINAESFNFAVVDFIKNLVPERYPELRQSDEVQ